MGIRDILIFYLSVMFFLIWPLQHLAHMTPPCSLKWLFTLIWRIHKLWFPCFSSDPSLPLKDTIPLHSSLGWLFYPCPWGSSSTFLVFTIIDVLLTLKPKSPLHFSLQNPRLTYSIISRIILYRCATAYKNQYIQTYLSVIQCLAQNMCSHTYCGHHVV